MLAFLPFISALLILQAICSDLPALKLQPRSAKQINLHKQSSQVWMRLVWALMSRLSSSPITAWKRCQELKLCILSNTWIWMHSNGFWIGLLWLQFGPSAVLSMMFCAISLLFLICVSLQKLLSRPLPLPLRFRLLLRHRYCLRLILFFLHLHLSRLLLFLFLLPLPSSPLPGIIKIILELLRSFWCVMKAGLWLRTRRSFG